MKSSLLTSFVSARSNAFFKITFAKNLHLNNRIFYDERRVNSQIRSYWGFEKMCCFYLQVQAPLLDSLTLKMEKLRFFETLVTIYQPAWHNVPELISECVVNNTRCYILRTKNYMFRPEVAIINFYHSTHLRLFYTIRVTAFLTRRSQRQTPCWSIVSLYSVYG